MSRGARYTVLAVAVAIVLPTVGCDDDEDPQVGAGSDTASGQGDTPSGTVTVLAAASLTESFEELAGQLAREYPDLEVVFSFGPSSGLVEQVISGAPADVLATADPTTMDEAVAADVVDGEPVVFARNALTLAVPAGNPAGVTGLADLADDDLRVAVCEPQVPCGAAAERLLDAAGVTAAPDTLTTDVKEAASLVALGEADAALIYRTDAAAEGDDIETLDVPEADEIVNDYPVALLADAANPDGARAIAGAITGELGRSVLAEAGFLEP
ncbi:molybdate ABC transporter substrate-binding protein [Jiangella asiatica]|uniref:Molybdate ABC transporter substrate-binding protein n=1 Tax=Jiangella asiatica TaxID=2530372 RepID=A0A4R5D6F0_9ACTN|nr:molybdate ABC transporter substrate-binding protein [Jiangella asiatica]TDE09082.1 molybdate ABC transporter substrate-binding protein [Jiangella asiatica]